MVPWYYVGLASICHFLVLDPHLKARSPIYDAQPIGLLYFIGPYLQLGASSKVALKEAKQFGRFLLCEMK
jgi:hypothetical protein